MTCFCCYFVLALKANKFAECFYVALLEIFSFIDFTVKGKKKLFFSVFTWKRKTQVKQTVHYLIHSKPLQFVFIKNFSLIYLKVRCGKCEHTVNEKYVILVWNLNTYCLCDTVFSVLLNQRFHFECWIVSILYSMSIHSTCESNLFSAGDYIFFLEYFFFLLFLYAKYYQCSLSMHVTLMFLNWADTCISYFCFLFPIFFNSKCLTRSFLYCYMLFLLCIFFNVFLFCYLIHSLYLSLSFFWRTQKNNIKFDIFYAFFFVHFLFHFFYLNIFCSIHITLYIYLYTSITSIVQKSIDYYLSLTLFDFRVRVASRWILYYESMYRNCVLHKSFLIYNSKYKKKETKKGSHFSWKDNSTIKLCIT